MPEKNDVVNGCAATSTAASASVSTAGTASTTGSNADSTDPGFIAGLPRELDVFEFVRRRQEVRGKFSVHHLSRLLHGLPEQPVAGQAGAYQDAGVARFEARGLGEVDGKALLELSVHTVLRLECQRCLEPMPYQVEGRAVFEVVRSESELGSDDEAEDDDEPERIVGSRRFDLAALIEDELILGVPYIPRHESCPGQSEKPAAADPDAVERPSPFAVLGRLKDQDKQV